MPSKRHERVKKILNSAANKLKEKNQLPRLELMRPILEFSRMFYLLPWGIYFKKIQLRNLDSVRTIPSEVILSSHPDKEHIILYFHGGGYTIGSMQTHRSLVGKLVKKTNFTAILPDYAMAPEQPFPAAVEDAVFSYISMLERGKRPENIYLAGDSAGGGLVLAAMSEIKRLQLPMPGCGVCLSPWVDLAVTGESILKNKAEDPLVDIEKLHLWAKMYSGNFPVEHPLISPLYADLRGLPPLLIQVSNSEMLYDDSVRLAAKARKDGVDVTLQEWDGLIHWWHLFQKMIPEACEAIEKISEYLKEINSKKLISQKSIFMPEI
jgi:acetyl esterase/lipase